jgi:hypothetical protein
MKKYFIPVLLCIVVGVLMGKVLLDQYKIEEVNIVSSDNIEEKVYFFQAGVYSNIDNAKNSSNNLDSYIIVEQDSKFYVYVGITKNEENKEKLKNFFDSEPYDTYLKEIIITNLGFLENLEQYDILLKEASTESEIKAVNKTVLATYEEIMNND